MRISSCTFSLFYQPVPAIRREAFTLEEGLKGYTKPFQIHSIPDDAPFELPRVTATTEHGHSILSISPQSAQVQSRFDEKFSDDYEKSLEYSKSKALELHEALSYMESITGTFCGVAVQLLVPASELESSPVDFINEHYLCVKGNLPMSDASAMLVYTVDDDLYLNIEVQKAVMSDPFSVNINAEGITVMKRFSPDDEELLSIAIDFNNRLAFNKGAIPGCNKEAIDSFYSRIQCFLTEGFSAFLKNGEVRF